MSTSNVTLMDVSAVDGWSDILDAEAATEGFRFIDRLQREWCNGENTFSDRGERLLVAYIGGTVAGTCGLNRDPFASGGTTGRMRHLYVRPIFRRSGVGRALVEELLTSAPQFFKRVRLRTDTAEAANFYLALGFASCAEAGATHVICFPSRR